MSQPVEITIDRLVVHGLDRADAATVEQDLRAALEQVVTEWATAGTPPPPAGHRRPRTRVTIEHDATTPLGERVATAVAAAIQQPPSAPEPGTREVAP